MNPRAAYDRIVKEMEPGLERAVLSVLRFHLGGEHAILKRDLMSDLNRMGFGKELSFSSFERQVREAISRLRDTGIPACASSGNGGYFIGLTWDEFDKFIGGELDKRVVTIVKRKRAMIDAASQYLGVRPNPQGQGSLF